jgi:glycosyltransferase involved in cell wall biosynthesis
VCGKGGPGVATLPPEVEVVTEIPLARLIDLMASSRAHVLPLDARRISTGQTVLLQAMALGKPVIATRTAGTEDYIDDGVTGLLVPPRDPAALRAALVALWADPGRIRTLGEAGREAVANSYLPTHYVDGVARALGCRVSLQSSPKSPTGALADH